MTAEQLSVVKSRYFFGEQAVAAPLGETQNTTHGDQAEKRKRLSFWVRSPRKARGHAAVDAEGGRGKGGALSPKSAKGKAKSRKGKSPQSESRKGKGKGKGKGKAAGGGERPDNGLAHTAALDTLNDYVEILPSSKGSSKGTGTGSSERLWSDQSWVSSVVALNDLCAGSDYEQGNPADFIRAHSDESDLALDGFGGADEHMPEGREDAEDGDPGYCVVKPFGSVAGPVGEEGGSAVLVAARHSSTLPDHHVDTGLGELLASMGDDGSPAPRSRALALVPNHATPLGSALASVPEIANVPAELSLSKKLEWLRDLEATNC